VHSRNYSARVATAVEHLVLGIDFGTSNTVAVLRWPDGRSRPLLFDGTPLLPSAVLLDDRDALLVGREALHAARARPQSFEPNPKLRIDEGSVLLDEREVGVPALIGAVLRRVADEAERVAGHPTRVVLTCPASWGRRRREALVEAAQRAGLGWPALVEEPVAAARYFVQVHGSRVGLGAPAVVYDFGAGTFDASVVRRTEDGFDVLACEGLPDAGGLDIDAAIVGYLGAVYAGRFAEQWDRLERPQSTAERRARRMLWEDVRTAKETLSRSSQTLLAIPLLDEEVTLGREQLERLARPILDRTVAVTVAAVRAAGVRPSDIAGLFLVGGSSRIPLCATLLHTALGIAPTAIEQPELVVAEGSVLAGLVDTQPPETFVVPTDRIAPADPVSAMPAAPVSPQVDEPAPPDRRPTTTVRGVARVPAPDVAAQTEAVARAESLEGTEPAARMEPAARTEPAPRVEASSPTVAVMSSGPRGHPMWLRAGLTFLVLLIVALVLASVQRAPRAFEIGLLTPLQLPAYWVLPAQLLVMLVGVTPGAHGILAAASAWAALRYGALFAAGVAGGFGLGFAPYEFQTSQAWHAWWPRLAIVAGIGFVVAGVGALLAAFRQRAQRTQGGWQGYLVPVLAGLGLGLSSLANLNHSDEVFLGSFFGGRVAVDLARFFVFSVGAAVLLTAVALLASALRVLLPPSGPSASTRRWLIVGTGAALLVAGAATLVAGITSR
jgi:Hsp70 protein